MAGQSTLSSLIPLSLSYHSQYSTSHFFYDTSMLQERIAFHRQQLKQRLGLTAQGKVFSTGIDQLFDDSDLLIQSAGSPSASDSKRNEKKVNGFGVKDWLVEYSSLDIPWKLTIITVAKSMWPPI